MFVKDLYVENKDVVRVGIEEPAKGVLDMLRESGYRCVPVVGEFGEYLGMIYKVHLLEYLYVEQGNPSQAIRSLVKHQDEFIDEEDTFVTALSKIKALPFISVVKDGKLLGILTHNRVMGVLEDSFGLGTGGINFTISSFESVGVIDKLSHILKNENIQGMFTLDNGSKLVRRIVFTVPKGKTEKEIDILKNKLEKSGMRVINIEFL